MKWYENIALKLANEKKRPELLRKQGLNIGTGCSVANAVGFGSEPYLITIGDNVRITKNVQFITHDGGLWVVRNIYPKYSGADLIKPITVGNNVHIGIGATIMPGVHIGNNCVIGCGAIVTRDIPDNSIAVGIPAKVIESIEEYVAKNEKDFINTKGLSVEMKKKQLLNN